MRALDEDEADLTNGLLRLMPDMRLTAKEAASHRALNVPNAAVGSNGRDAEASGGASQPVVSSSGSALPRALNVPSVAVGSNGRDA